MYSIRMQLIDATELLNIDMVIWKIIRFNFVNSIEYLFTS